MSEYCEHAADKIQQLLDRIEELERQAVSHVCQATFTKAQIDAAVMFANDPNGGDYARDISWRALNKLGIERCETCPWHQPVPDVCPKCNGHQWVIKCASE
jgi:hypothetical protein